MKKISVNCKSTTNFSTELVRFNAGGLDPTWVFRVRFSGLDEINRSGQLPLVAWKKAQAFHPHIGQFRNTKGK